MAQSRRNILVENFTSRTPWVATLLLLAITCLAAWKVRQSNVEGLESTFTARTQNVSNGLRENVLFHEKAVQAMANLFEVHGDVSRAQFATAAARHAPDLSGTQALEWVPAVPHSDRDGVEQSARQDGLEGFSFQQWQPAGGWQRNPEDWAEEYFPVYYVYPTAGNEQALGIDLASQPTRNAALRRCRETSKAAATGRIALALETGSQAGFLLFIPAGDRGFAVGVFPVGDFFDSVLAGRDVTGLQLRVTDLSSQDEDEQLLYESKGITSNIDPRWQEEFLLDVGGGAGA
mgnify:FL=1